MDRRQAGLGRHDLSGTLTLIVGGAELTLAPGDSFQFSEKD
ncbi:hypothetical protein [Paracoccus sp. SSK6]